MRYLTTLFNRTRLMTILLAGALLGACGTTATQSPGISQPTAVPQPSAIPQPTGAPNPTAVPQPTIVPQPTVAPNPTVEGAPVGVLPAPLYLLSSGPEDNGQITRLERDGKTRTKLTDEHADRPDSLAVIEFDISPADGIAGLYRPGSSWRHPGPDRR
jgi:hypothetical protein